MLFPLYDDDSKLKKTAWVTIIFLIANIAVFLYQQSNPAFTQGYSAVPHEILTNTDLVGEKTITVGEQTGQIPHTPGPVPLFLTLFTAMFMHGGWMHLGSNMLFLWIFGDNVELRFGAVRFIIFYLVSGVVASLTHILMAPTSIIPSLGASGAIYGILGAYLVMFPRNRINTLFFIKIISLPAIVVIGFFAVTQVATMWMMNKNGGMTGGGVAYSAHVGGLVAGIVMGLAFRFIIDREPDSILYRNYDRDEKARQIW